jgi:poly(hydroxyalkanoate) depolymerase family esterase
MVSLAKLGVSTLLVSASVLTFSPRAFAGSWEALNYGGSNTMSVYKPTSPAASPALIVSLHFCGGSMANAQGWFQSSADKYGFLVIAGKSKGGCWDAAIGRSGERAIIVQAVDYVVKNYNADKSRVFAAGASSGACMTQALLASYPEVFAGGSSLAGVPAGGWTGGGEYGWSAPSSTTAQQWGDKVRQANPEFIGSRPRLQLWQGKGDTILTYASAYPAQVAQWTNVFVVTDASAMKSSIKPTGAQDTWDRASYKDGAGAVVLEANSGPSSVPHDLTPRGLWPDVVRFFGLDGSTPGPTGGAGGASSGGASSGGAGGAGGMNTGGTWSIWSQCLGGARRWWWRFGAGSKFHRGHGGSRGKLRHAPNGWHGPSDKHGWHDRWKRSREHRWRHSQRRDHEQRRHHRRGRQWRV